MKKIFFFVAFFLSFAQIAFAATIFTSDSSGNLKTSFYSNETVYLAPSAVNVTTNSTSVRIYIVQDSNNWVNQTNLTDASGAYKTYSTNASGYLNATNLIWPPTLVAGNYDVVVDVNANGVYDSGIDFVFNSSTYGFQVVPAPGPALTIFAGENNTASHTYTIPSTNPENVMMQIKITSGIYESVKINTLSLVANGTGDDSKGITIVKLILDSDNDGRYDSGETLLAFDKYAHDNGVVQLSISNGHTLTANTTVYFLVVYTMSNTSSNGQTYNFQVASLSAVGATTGTNSRISGLPINSAIKTISMSAITTSSTTTTTSATTTTTVLSSTTTTSTTTITQNQPNYFWTYIAIGISVAVIVVVAVLYYKASREFKYEYKPQQ